MTSKMRRTAANSILLQQADFVIESFDPVTCRPRPYVQLPPPSTRASYMPPSRPTARPADALSPATDLTIEAGALVGLQEIPTGHPVPVGYPQASFHGGAQAAADCLVASTNVNAPARAALDVSMQAAMV
ncbi:MAG: hypothetical protein IPF51_16370 [Dehalococcoidia bacterium]|uniref:hypothetical protein n=1 Tax=Candidatus Amarobacter glycogenicus TaxID=3140699 RepID=UPI003136EE9E|nr:hypothetical protein [Dehalococcoidia bacterium]